MLSPAIRISLRQEANPMVTLNTSEVFFAEDDALVRGFEVAMQWIDETLPKLTLESNGFMPTDENKGVPHELELTRLLESQHSL
jgi:hypothetical protein